MEYVYYYIHRRPFQVILQSALWRNFPPDPEYNACSFRIANVRYIFRANFESPLRKLLIKWKISSALIEIQLGPQARWKLDTSIQVFRGDSQGKVFRSREISAIGGESVYIYMS